MGGGGEMAAAYTVYKIIQSELCSRDVVLSFCEPYAYQSFSAVTSATRLLYSIATNHRWGATLANAWASFFSRVVPVQHSAFKGLD